MPPYSSQKDSTVRGFDNDDSYFVDAPLLAPSKQNGQADNEYSESSFPFLNLFEFDPCVGFGGITVLCNAFPNSSSGILKARSCAECGRNCNKIQGYIAEIAKKKTSGTRNSNNSKGSQPKQTDTTTKIYHHKWCLQIKEWRIEHAKTYRTVLNDLLAHIMLTKATIRQSRRRGQARKQIGEDVKKKEKLGLMKRAKNFCHIAVKKEKAKKPESRNKSKSVENKLSNSKKPSSTKHTNKNNVKNPSLPGNKKSKQRKRLHNHTEETKPSSSTRQTMKKKSVSSKNTINEETERAVHKPTVNKEKTKLQPEAGSKAHRGKPKCKTVVEDLFLI